MPWQPIHIEILFRAASAFPCTTSAAYKEVEVSDAKTSTDAAKADDFMRIPKQW
jgi:hypothetical protein